MKLGRNSLTVQFSTTEMATRCIFWPFCECTLYWKFPICQTLRKMRAWENQFPTLRPCYRQRHWTPTSTQSQSIHGKKKSHPSSLNLTLSFTEVEDVKVEITSTSEGWGTGQIHGYRKTEFRSTLAPNVVSVFILPNYAPVQVLSTIYSLLNHGSSTTLNINTTAI